MNYPTNYFEKFLKKHLPLFNKKAGACKKMQIALNIKSIET